MSRKLVVEIIGDSSSLNRSLKEATVASNRFGKDVSQSLRGVVSGSGIMHSFGRQIAFASTTFLGGAGLVAALKGSSEAASNMAEQISKSNVVFAGSAKQVEGWATTSATAMGLAQDQALATAGSFGALLRPIGLTGQAAAAQSEKLTQLGADLASFYNTSVQDALDAVQSGIVGESRPLRSYGVLLSEARVQQEALTETGKTNAKQLTNQEKVLARIAIIYKDTGQAQGDFARTSDGLANQQRILAANVRDLEAAIGTALNPALLDVIKNLNAWLGQSKNQQQVQHDVKKAVDLAVGAFKAAKAALDTLNSITGSMTDTFKLLLGVFAGFKVLRMAAWFEGLTGAVKGAGAAATVAEGETAALSTGLSGLTAAPWIITVLVAYKDIKDPGSIVDRAKSFFNFAKGGGPLEKALENLPNIGPIIKSINQATGAFSRGRPPISRDYFVPRPTAATAATAAAFVPHDLPTSQAAAPIVGRGGLTPMQRAQLAESAAGLTKTTTDNLKALVTQRVLLAKAIQTETARLNQATSAEAAKKFADNLQKLQDNQSAVMGRIASITEKGAQTAKRTGAEIAAQRNTWFDTAIGRMLDRVQDIPQLQGQIGRLRQIAGLIQQQIQAARDITRKQTLGDQLAQVYRSIKADQDQVTQNAADAAQAAAQRQAATQQKLLDRLQFNVDRTQLTKTLTDDLNALLAQKAGVEKIIKLRGDTLEREQALLAVELAINAKKQEIVDARAGAKQAQADKAAKQVQARLDAANLTVAKAGLTETLKDDLAANQNLLAVMRKTGASAIDIVNQQKTINDVKGQLADQITAGKKSDDKAAAAADKATQSTRKLFRHLNATAFVNQFGANLTREQKRRLEIGLAMTGPGGTLPAGRSGQFTAGITIHGGVHMHGVQDVPGLENQIAKRAKARPHVRRGARG